MGRVLIGNFKGPKGDKGDDGARGPQGPKGEQGATGLVNGEGILEFEDYSAEGAEVPSTEEALAGIASGKSLKDIISSIKAFCKGVVTLGMIVDNLDDALAITDDKIPVGCKALQGLNAKLSENKTGARIELTTSKYTFPVDGYVRAYTDGTAGASVNVGISDSDGNTFTSISASPYVSSSSVFVRKGMMGHILSRTNTTNVKAWFIPLTE